MNAPVPAGWKAHEFEEAGGQFQVLIRKTARMALTAPQCSVAGALHQTPPVTERSRAHKTVDIPGSSAKGHKPQMGPRLSRPDPASRAGRSTSVSTGSVVAFGDLESVRSMGTGRSGLIIGFDTEFTTDGGERTIESWQFATPDLLNPSLMVEIVILPLNDRRVGLQTALWEVVRAASLWRSPLVRAGVDDRGVRRDVVLGNAGAGAAGDAARAWERNPLDWEARSAALAPWRIPVVLACHYGAADLTTFRADGRVTDHLTRLTAAAGGLVTLLPFRLQGGDGRGDGYGYWRALSVTVRDTMGLAPAGHKALAAIGAAVDINKIVLPGDWITRMGEYRRQHLSDFLEYGVNDAVIVVEFLARVWGEGVLPPATLGGGAAASLVASGSSYFGVDSPKEFRLLFSGLVEEDGVEVVDVDDELSFYSKRGRIPVDGSAAQLSKAYASGYHGGLNSCPAPGYYPVPTVDIDAQNAYPTAMALVTDLDWRAGCIESVVHERKLTIDDLPDPTMPFIGFVEFVFPEEVPFPSIPIVADGTLIYPRSSSGTAGTWVCGPELWLALQLGAEVFCQIGYHGRSALRPDGARSLSLRHGVKQLIDDRSTAKREFGAGSIEEKTLKDAVNTIYGKTAQDVAEQRSWDAYKQEMDNVGGSAITSPFHAATTTSLVRAQLLATLNQIEERGGRVFSVTTDGFITDWAVQDVEALDLYGLALHLHEARTALTGNPAIWEAKHQQDDLVNFTTRGNVSLNNDGVCAHNGLKRPEGVAPDSREDRESLLESVVTRAGRVENPFRRFPSFQDLSRKQDRKDFIPFDVERALSMDYDLKRRPLMSTMVSMQVPLPDGSLHELASFSTEPWDTIDECLRARRIAREIARTGCLRTFAEWQGWHIRFAHGSGRRMAAPSQAVLSSIVMAHRQGVISIPTLAARDLTLTQRLEWLGRWGLGAVSEADWKNARRPERASQMLPLSELEPWLARMVATDPGTVAVGGSDGGPL